LLHDYLLVLGQQLPELPQSCPGLQAVAGDLAQNEYAPTPTAASMTTINNRVFSPHFPFGAPPQPQSAALFLSVPPQQLADNSLSLSAMFYLQ
jgi:hypothetical protein